MNILSELFIIVQILFFLFPNFFAYVLPIKFQCKKILKDHSIFDDVPTYSLTRKAIQDILRLKQFHLYLNIHIKIDEDFKQS